MDTSVVEVKRRAEIGSAAVRRLRRTGHIPAVLYGHGEEVVPLTVQEEKIRGMVTRQQHMVTLRLDDGEQQALIKDVQYDTYGRRLLHVDFARVALHERVTVSVLVELHGTPKGVASGGVLEQPLNNLEMECRADQIPERLRVEVSHLDLGQMVHVGEIAVPEGTKVLIDLQAVVAILHPPKGLEEKVEAPAEAGPAEPEVIGRAAKEEEQEEAE